MRRVYENHKQSVGEACGANTWGWAPGSDKGLPEHQGASSSPNPERPAGLEERAVVLAGGVQLTQDNLEQSKDTDPPSPPASIGWIQPEARTRESHRPASWGREQSPDEWRLDLVGPVETTPGGNNGMCFQLQCSERTSQYSGCFFSAVRLWRELINMTMQTRPTPAFHCIYLYRILQITAVSDTLNYQKSSGKGLGEQYWDERRIITRALGAKFAVRTFLLLGSITPHKTYFFPRNVSIMFPYPSNQLMLTSSLIPPVKMGLKEP